MMLKDDALRRSEHNAVRNFVGYYDFTHQLLEVSGEDAGAFLDMIYVNSIAKLKVGAAKYTTMLNEQGEILDDVIVFRMEEQLFRISTLYINELIHWLDAHKGEYRVSYKDITPDCTMYAIQGPQSRELLNRVLNDDISQLPFYGICRNQIGGTTVYIARSGFTGELGYELYCAPVNAAELEETLVANGTDLGLTKITTDVIIGSLPREKGYVLMQDLQGANPLEAGFGWTVDLKKDFIGKAVTERLKAEGVTRNLLGFELVEDGEVALGDDVVVHGETVGKVTSFTYGYTVEKYIGYTLASAPAKPGDEAVIGNSQVKAKLCDRIWYDKKNTRSKG